MPCPNCGHTVQNLGIEGKLTFWCPRCGTIKTETRKPGTNEITWEEHESPKLAAKIRELVIDMRRYIIRHGILLGECVAWSGIKELTSVGQDHDCPSEQK